MSIYSVSVIIPIYKVEMYIERCARSLLGQTLDDVEFIFVDDCTPDKSIEILQNVINDYPQRKDYIRIVQMPQNSGQAAVRKYGTSLASGKYIIHCDSDDWVDCTIYEKLYKKAESEWSDLVFYDFYKTNGESCKVIKRNATYKDKSALISELLEGKLMGCMWGVLVKAELYRNIEWPLGNMMEDLAIVVQLVMRSNKNSYVPESLYYYYYNEMSITKTFNYDFAYKRFLQAYDNLEMLFAVMNRAYIYNQFTSQIFVLKVRTKIYLLSPYILDSDCRKIWKTKWSDLTIDKVFKNTEVSQIHKFIYCLSIVGIYPLYKIVKMYTRSISVVGLLRK